MLVSTKGRYALRVLIDLAQQPREAYVPLKEIAQRQDISEKYLESILRILVKANVLAGVRGKGGGYRLNAPPEEHSVGSILLLTEESLAPVSCLGKEVIDCDRASTCPTLSMWKGLHELIQNYLNDITIADLVNNPNLTSDYVI